MAKQEEAEGKYPEQGQKVVSHANARACHSEAIVLHRNVCLKMKYNKEFEAGKREEQ